MLIRAPALLAASTIAYRLPMDYRLPHDFYDIIIGDGTPQPSLHIRR